ncbi:MAG: hypothetical protein A2381_01565 [Bdellovibrionales bacterium RIFOXYB1_FULL_37_110]|nr:MAG: hypothetical protein A2417_02420 [Bdellovibrionales bacterium RIFOXYC1_FULL_37_79]OFZ58904.1 MAG: hypothetical protein A2381_01565 [Bdellovibrionales bacterium RIFOXYB1_FULL_37_110]OFZ64650.1 MAG: hypothetical protein A2577_13370 [Bdellovibrionales bacterium RIFOXYD1_FULL_36_51]
MKKIIFFVLILICFSLQAYIDLFSDIGYTNIQSSFNDKIDVLHLGVGSTLALGHTFFCGIQTEYQAITRLIKTNEQLEFYKNQKSLYILPVLGIDFGSIILKISTANIGYYFLKQEKYNTAITNKKPSGIIITVLKKVGKNWFWGSSYSSTTFKEVKLSGEAANQDTVSQTSKMLTASLITGYNF